MSFTGIMILMIVIVLMAMLFKQGKSEYGMFLIILASLSLFLLILSEMQTVIETIRKIRQYIVFEETYINILIKMIGISYLTQFSSDVCKDSGYQTLANQIQIFGKISVLAVCMPILLTLLETVKQVLEQI